MVVLADFDGLPDLRFVRSRRSFDPLIESVHMHLLSSPISHGKSTFKVTPSGLWDPDRARSPGAQARVTDGWRIDVLHADLGRDPTVLAFIEPYLPVSSPYLPVSSPYLHRIFTVSSQLNKGGVLNLVDRYNDDLT